jgi:hypothetical protein
MLTRLTNTSCLYSTTLRDKRTSRARTTRYLERKELKGKELRNSTRRNNNPRHARLHRIFITDCPGKTNLQNVAAAT